MIIKISDLLRIIIAASWSILIVFGNFFISDHPYIDSWGLLLISLISLVLFLGCGLAKKSPPILIVAFLIYSFILTRLIFVYFYPEGFLGYDKLIPELFNHTLVFILLGTLTSILGVHYGYRAISKKQVLMPRLSNFIPFQRILKLALFVIGFKLAVTFYYGFLGATGSGEHLNLFLRYGLIFINPFCVVILLLISAYNKSASLKHERLYVFMTLFLYFTYLGLDASRSGFFEIIILLICYYSFFKGDVEFKVNLRLIAFFSFLIVAAYPCYSAITLFRKSTWVAGQTFSEASKSAIDSFWQLDESLPDSINKISYRVSLVEPIFYVMNGTAVGLYDVSDLVNLKTTVLSALTRLLPGNPLGEYLFTEYAYGYIYKREGSSYQSASNSFNYVGYEWGMYAISYQIFGFIGGLIAIFFISFFISSIVGYLRAKPGVYYNALGLFMLYTLCSWVRNLGLDNLFDRTGRVGIVLLLYCFVYSWMKDNRLSTRSYELSGTRV